MSKPKTDTRHHGQAQSPEPGASPGPNPIAETPRDIGPEYASARDKTERNIASDDVDESEEALLDDAIESTFPASDPIALPTYEEAQALKKRKAQTASKSNTGK
jgi:hypothetical protein